MYTYCAGSLTLFSLFGEMKTSQNSYNFVRQLAKLARQEYVRKKLFILTQPHNQDVAKEVM